MIFYRSVVFDVNSAYNLGAHLIFTEWQPKLTRLGRMTFPLEEGQKEYGKKVLKLCDI